MHDPLTVAFEIRWPIPGRSSWNIAPRKRWLFEWPYIKLAGKTYRFGEAVIVWHVDPDLGSDDSCMNAYRLHRVLRKTARRIRSRDGTYDPAEDVCLREGFAYSLRDYIATRWINRVFPWRWHVWHYRIQVPLVLDLKRWLFSRCNGCRKRFRFGASPVSTSWNSAGPRWFRQESDVYHESCLPQPNAEALPTR